MPRERVSAAATIPARAAFALGGIYLLLLLVASRLPAPGGLWASVIAISVFVYLPLAIMYHGVRIPLTASGELVAGLMSLGVWLGITGVAPQADATIITPARSVALLCACLFFGMLASRIMRDRNILVPACIVAAVADLLSVGWGFTGRALEETPELVTKLSIVVPTLAASGASQFPIVATMGVGDLFFVALFFAAAARFGLPLRRTFCYVFPLIALAMVLTVLDVLPWKGIPGLPFIVVGFLTANSRSFTFTRDEWRSLAIVGGVLLVVAVVALLAMKHVT